MGSAQLVRLGEAAPGPLLEDVEVLPDRDLGAHLVEDLACRLPRGDRRDEPDAGVEQFVAPAEQEVAEQQRGGLAEAERAPRPSARFVQSLETAVRRRPAAPGVGVVHDVVVHEGGRVEDLERTGRENDRMQFVGRRLVDERIEARSHAHRLPAPVTEQCAEPLTAFQQIA